MKITKDWLTGFVDGEGCFMVSIINNPTMEVGYQVQLEFVITQHERDVQLLHAIRKYWQCGLVRRNRGKDSQIWVYRVRDFQSIGEKILPFFEKNGLLTTKKYNFQNFRKAYNLVASKSHLTKEGLEEIKKIKEKMNRKAVYETVSETNLDKDIVPTLLKDKDYSDVDPNILNRQ